MYKIGRINWKGDKKRLGGTAVALLVSYNECKVNNIHTKHTREIIIIVNTESFFATASITLTGKKDRSEIEK